MTASPDERRADPPVDLLDGNVLYALIDEAHVHHDVTRTWFAASTGDFATCPITQGTLVRLAIRIGERSIADALQLLAAVTDHPRHRFWPDSLPYAQVRWTGVIGHRQVTDAYLAALARSHGGRLATLDRGLVALHPDVGLPVDSPR